MVPKPVEPNLNQGKASRLRLYLSLAIIAIWIIIGFFVFQDIGELIQWFDGLGTLGSIVYCLLITVAIILMAPSPILKVGAGALFPYWIAVVVNFVASIVGGLIAFLLGRWMFRDYIANIVSKDERLKRIETAINNEAMQISVLVRLSPIIPDEWLNYIMASSPVSFRVFFVSSLSSIVYSLAYAYFGLAAGELVFSGNVMENFSNSPAGTILLIIGVVASIIVTFFIARITKNALENKVDVV
tara:strand:- start:91 stop:819 length:729 start_codon:yes stop_codon:yes gene_type:complete